MPNAFGLLDYDWDAPLSDEDRDRLLGRMAATFRKWRLEVPVVLFLETSAPLSHIGGQSLVAFSPLIAPLLRGGLNDVQRLSQLLNRPENVRRLIDILSEEPHAARE